MTWTASYEAYGKRTKETGENKDKQRGNSKDEDPTGLLNEGFRYRDLETGVWLSRDPAGFVDGPNVYAYVKQNPWTGFDPHGLADGGGFFSDFGGQLWDNVSGAYEYVAYGLAGCVETVSGGMLYPGCSEQFNKSTFAAVNGIVNMGNELTHAGLRIGLGDFGQAEQHLMSALGDTPGKALANVTTIAVTEGISRTIKTPKSEPSASSHNLTLTNQEMVDALVNHRTNTGAPPEATFSMGRDGKGNLTKIRESGKDSGVHAEPQTLKDLEGKPRPHTVVVDQQPCSACGPQLKSADATTFVPQDVNLPERSVKNSAVKAANGETTVIPREVK